MDSRAIVAGFDLDDQWMLSGLAMGLPDAAPTHFPIVFQLISNGFSMILLFWSGSKAVRCCLNEPIEI